MLDINYIRENVEEVKQNCLNRRACVDIDQLLALDDQRRTLQQQIDELRAKRKQGSKGKPSEEEIAAMRQLGEEISDGEKKFEAVRVEYQKLLFQVPKVPYHRPGNRNTGCRLLQVLLNQEFVILLTLS